MFQRVESSKPIYEPKFQKNTKSSQFWLVFENFKPKLTWEHRINQVVKYVHINQYIGEFERLILSSQIVIGEF